MAKISPVAIKYLIDARFESNGVIEKPDIIGAIFGQTEGLLGEDLEMRELQKSGKIGRIEVTSNYEDGKTVGEIEIPSAMDKTETTLIAAALETIERIGPSDTKITIEKIEDVRGSKRDYILERAKKLMERLGGSGNGISDMTNEIQSSSRISKIHSYGTENLPCGDISGDELIIVEGRADVINLMRNGVKNVIAMNGARLPETLKGLTREKPEVILFVDGDRGGNLIIKNVVESAKIDFISMAPEGKEVEELTGKEILQALRKKLPSEEYKENKRSRGVRRYDRERRDKTNTKDRKIKKITSEEKEKIKKEVDELIGTKGAIIFNKNLEIIKKVPVGRLGLIKLDDEPYVIAIDGTATPKVIENCERLGCQNLIATNFVFTDTKINLASI
ncbi:DNA primase [Candidatus Pacearchaeota archaeon]|nr:DNA primase [Candidatus Pacearchaeota archaeon]MBD3283467.1 DNA primase [Candidatus Pacearchaeota archaeon]